MAVSTPEGVTSTRTLAQITLRQFLHPLADRFGFRRNRRDPLGIDALKTRQAFRVAGDGDDVSDPPRQGRAGTKPVPVIPVAPLTMTVSPASMRARFSARRPTAVFEPRQS